MIDFFQSDAPTEDPPQNGVQAFFGLVEFARGLPTLGRIILPEVLRGKLPIPLPEYMGETDNQKDTQVAQDEKRKERRKKVLRFSDAAECVEAAFESGGFLKQMAAWVLSDNLLKAPPGLAQGIINCMEKKVLQQERLRVQMKQIPSDGKAGRPKGVKNGEGGKGPLRYRRRGDPGGKA
jgi:hypothetical protein